MTKKVIKTGDYVEVLGGESAGIKIGEQGFVVDGSDQGSIEVLFPARRDLWKDTGWYVRAKQVKRLYRPRVS